MNITNENKMNAKELRVGNYYNHNAEIKKITPNDILEVWESERIWCKPIPLTEEWLVKLGFEKSEKGSVSIQFNIGENPLTKDWIMQLVWLKTLPDYNLEESLFYRNGFHKLKHVHQLQNLYFALTGQELEI